MQNINVSSSKIIRSVRALYCTRNDLFKQNIDTRGCFMFVFRCFILACREQLGQINDNCKKERENVFFYKKQNT